MPNATKTAGRAYLLTINGDTYHDPRPSYLMTWDEADDTMRNLRAVYGGDYGIVDASRLFSVEPTCVSNYPGNGSHCRLPFGHDGRCEYFEPLDGKPRTWQR